MASMKELRCRAYESNMELERRGLVIYTFGNVSAIDRDKGIVAIKPSGVSYDKLRPENMVLVDLHNRVVEGKFRPSSDTKTHTCLYRNFPEIGGVVHTHSSHATAWAQAGRAIPCLGTTHADYAPGEIPCTKLISDKQIKGDYEEETGNQILEAFKRHDYRYTPMTIVAGHGPFTWGADAEKAVHNAAVLEEIARMAMFTSMINPQKGPLKKTLIDKHFFRKHGKNAYYGN